MTSQLNVDTIVDKAGSGGTNVKMANNAVTVSEGGNATTNTVQGLCKCWANITGTGTVALDDSFNASGITDNQTGDYTIAFSNALSSGNYSTTLGVAQTTIGARKDAAESASTVKVSCMNSSFGLADEPSASLTVHGDLA